MAKPFTFVRNLLQKGRPEGCAEHNLLSTVVEPGTVSLAEAEAKFYCAIFDLPALPGAAPMEVPLRLVLDVVRNSLTERESRAKAVPRLPSVIPKLLRSLRDPDTSAKDYVAIINKDPAMSAAVLGLANSVYFNPSANRINSIDVAVVKLGIHGLRSVLSAAVMQPLIQRQTDPFAQFGQRLWEHTLNCAVACELIATQRGLEPYKAYLLGLTHETGKITLFSEVCKQLRRNGSPDEQMGAALFIPLMREKSASLSAAIAVDWDLPKEICTALQQQVELQPGRMLSPYGQVLFQANLACEALAIQQITRNGAINLSRLAEELSLPAGFFSQLAQLSTQV